MKLFNADLSPNCIRVRALIFELGLPVDIVDVDLRQKERPAELLAVNPNGKVPAFVDDDGFGLFESRAIERYLASKKPDRQLYPDDAKKRAVVDQWTYWHAVHLQPAMNAVIWERVLKPMFKLGDPDESLAKEKMAEVERLLPVLDKGLAGKEWLVGSLTVADFSLAATFGAASERAGISLAKTPNIAAWLKRVQALPSFQKALPKMG